MKQEIENFIEIPGFEDYLINIVGMVWSKRRSKFLKYSTPRDYLQVSLCKDKKVKSLYVHRLVWISFRGPIPKGLQINHKDENKRNNCLYNLELLTPKENTNYGTRNKRSGESLKKSEKFKKAIILLSKNKQKSIQVTNCITGEVSEFPSIKAFVAFLKTSYANLKSHIARAKKKGSNVITINKVPYMFNYIRKQEIYKYN